MSDVTLMAQWLAGHDLENLAPPPPPSMPTIEMITEFHGGTTHARGADIEYIATPSEGAHIIAVDVYSNGTFTGAIYISETYPHSLVNPRGTLGQGRISFRRGENQITISVEDSAGLTASHVIENLPYRVYQEDFFVEGFPEKIIERPDGRLIQNRINVSLFLSDDPVDLDAITEALASVQGEIERFSTSSIIVYVPSTDAEEIMAKAEYLTENFPHLFRWALAIEEIRYKSAGSSPREEGGGFFSSDLTVGSSFRTNNTNRGGTGRDWVHHAVDFTRAWAVFGA
jgi:hypothetical protein